MEIIEIYEAVQCTKLIGRAMSLCSLFKTKLPSATEQTSSALHSWDHSTRAVKWTHSSSPTMSEAKELLDQTSNPRSPETHLRSFIHVRETIPHHLK